MRYICAGLLLILVFFSCIDSKQASTVEHLNFDFSLLDWMIIEKNNVEVIIDNRDEIIKIGKNLSSCVTSAQIRKTRTVNRYKIKFTYDKLDYTYLFSEKNNQGFIFYLNSNGERGIISHYSLCNQMKYICTELR